MDRSEVEIIILSVVVIPILGWLHNQISKVWIQEQKIECHNTIISAQIADLKARLERAEQTIDLLRGK